MAVARVGLDAGTGGQVGGGVGQRVLVHVCHQDGHAQLGAGHRHNPARHADDRQLARASDRQHEALGLGKYLVQVTIAVVLRDDGDRVVATLARARRKADHAGAPARSVGSLRVGRKRRQAPEDQGQRVAVGIGRFDRDLQHRAAIHKSVGDVLDLGRAVGIADDDGQGDLAAQRCAGAVAVVGGLDADVIGAGLGVAGRPDDLQRLGIEARTLGQARDGVADAGRRAFAAAGGAAGVQPDLGLEARVVGVDGEHADAQGLAFQQAPGLHGIKHRRAIGVAHIEVQRPLHGRSGAAAIGGGVGGRQRQGQREQACLGKARCPAEPAGVSVQGGPAGQPRRAPAQRDGAAVCLSQASGHKPWQLQAEAVALAQHLGVQRREDGRGIALGDGDVEAALHLVFTVARDHRDVLVDPGLGVSRRPAQQAAGGVEHGARRQVAKQHGDRVAIGVGGQQGQLQAAALREFNILLGIEHGQVVGPAHVEREAAQGHAAPAVDHAHQQFAVRTIRRLGRPAQDGFVAVAGGAAFHQWVLGEREARRAADDFPEEQTAIAVLRAELGRPGAADGGRRQCGGAEIQAVVVSDEAKLRRGVVIGHGVKAMAELELDPLAGARRGAEVAGRAHRDGLRGQGLAGLEHAALQGRAEIQQPQLGLWPRALRGPGDAVTEVTARVEQQHQRATQVVDADIGDAHVVADDTGAAVSAGVTEGQAHELADVAHCREHQAVRPCQRHLHGAAQGAGKFQTPAAGGQIGQGQDRALAGAIPAHTLGHKNQLAVRAGGDQAVVGGVEHRGRAGVVVCGRTRPHRLVEADRYLGQRQGHERSVADAGADNLGGFDGRNFVDTVGLRDQDAAISGRDDALAAGAAAGQLQGAARLQLDHPDGGGVGRFAGSVDGTLRGVGAGQQQPGQAGAGAAEGQAVNQAADPVLELGAAAQAPAHRETDDVGRRLGQGAVDSAAGPAHGPESAVRPEGQIADAGVGEVPPAVRLGIEALDPVAGRDIDQAGARLDRQCMGQRVAAGCLVARDDGAAAGVDQQQLGACHHPQLANGVERHVEHGGVEREQRRGRAAAFLGEAENLVALGAGAGQHRALGQLDHRQRTDIALAGGKAAGEATQLQRCQHRLQIGRLAWHDEAG